MKKLVRTTQNTSLAVIYKPPKSKVIFPPIFR
jgi:hypothetical protein